MNTQAPSEKKVLRLSSIANRIGEIIREKTSGVRFWMKAEVSSAHQNANGHTYFDFVEMQHGRQVAKLRAMIWRDDRVRIEKEFVQAGIEFKLENGKEITTECTIEFHPIFGLSVSVVDADPNYALGEIERRRRQTLLKLEKEGLFETNKQLPIPMLLKRIGVVTSKGSAGFKDFSETLIGFKYPVHVKVADSRMQGHRTERSVLDAINKLEKCNIDLVVILRGGGSKLDLGDLDNELIARRIARCRIPVWTAIGHETDESVLDYVSHSKFKTPTAVAEEILNRINALALSNSDGLNRLRTTWDKRITREKHTCENSRSTFVQRLESRIASSVSLLESQRNQLRLSVSNRISASERRRLSQCGFSFRRKADERLGATRQKLNLVKRNLRNTTKVRLRERGLLLVSSRAWFSPSRILSKVNSNRDVLSIRTEDFKKRIHRKIESERQLIQSKQLKVNPRLIRERLKSLKTQLKLGQTVIDSIDPVKNLKRGYALVFDSNSKLITSAKDLTTNQNVTLHLADGIASAKVTEVKQNDK